MQRPAWKIEAKGCRVPKMGQRWYCGGSSWACPAHVMAQLAAQPRGGKKLVMSAGWPSLLAALLLMLAAVNIKAGCETLNC